MSTSGPTILAIKARSRVEAAQAAYDTARAELVAALMAEAALLDAGTMPDDVAAIIRTVAAFYRLPEAVFRLRDQRAHVARPRLVAMALADELTHHGLEVIGDAFGGRDHSTVIHARHAVANRLKTEKFFENDWKVIRSAALNAMAIKSGQQAVA